MATRVNDERGFASLNRIIEEARAQKPAERVILKRPIGERLDEFVSEMHRSCLLYSEAVREFKKRFILTVLEQNGGNQCRAARELGMHRNTLTRTIAELKLDISGICRERRMTKDRQKKAARRAGIVPGQESQVIS